MIFGIIFSSFATDPDISSSTTTASCADAVLNTNGGNVNIEINWEPNVIPLRWYNGNTMVESNTCTYGGGLNIPTPPERTGYTFRGWRVRPQMDFSTVIPANAKEISRSSIGETTSHKDTCYYVGVKSDCNDEVFKDLKTQEWKIKFKNGTFYGMSKCSAKNGSDGVATNWTNTELDSEPGEKVYCWCRITGYKPNNTDTIYAPAFLLSWVKYAYTETCLKSCANNCSASCSNSDSRATLLTPVSNGN